MLKYILTAVLLVPDVASAGNFLDRLGISPGPPSKETVEKLAPYQDKAHPSFLQSAIFFMTGHEPPDQVIFVARPDGVVSAAVNRLMLERDRAAYEAVWEFKVRPDDPCTIMAYRVQPPYEIERLEFSKVPSPRTLRTDKAHSPIYAHVMDFPPETWCKSKAYMNSEGKIDVVRGTTMCDFAVMLGAAHNAHRRFAALDYIRANFCAGQPEPPPRPQKPY
jgi:hypothetical protein